MLTLKKSRSGSPKRASSSSPSQAWRERLDGVTQRLPPPSAASSSRQQLGAVARQQRLQAPPIETGTSSGSGRERRAGEQAGIGSGMSQATATTGAALVPRAARRRSRREGAAALGLADDRAAQRWQRRVGLGDDHRLQAGVSTRGERVGDQGPAGQLDHRLGPADPAAPAAGQHRADRPASACRRSIVMGLPCRLRGRARCGSSQSAIPVRPALRRRLAAAWS